MQNFQDTCETRKRSFICVFSICMAVPLKYFVNTKTSCLHIKSNFFFFKIQGKHCLHPFYKIYENAPVSLLIVALPHFNGNFTKNVQFKIRIVPYKKQIQNLKGYCRGYF